jgi:hypothetical protein
LARLCDLSLVAETAAFSAKDESDGDFFGNPDLKKVLALIRSLI